MSEFEDMLDNFVHHAKRRSPKVIAGDFKAWALELAFAKLNVVLANESNVSSFRK